MFPYGARRRLLYFQEYSLNESVIYEYKCANSSQFFSFYMELLHKYYTPLIMVIGFLGNFTSCLVLISTHLKLRSSSYYLAALSFADSGYLVCAFLVYCSSKDIFNLYDKQGFCQICIYLTYVFSFLSVWLIVAFTIERFIAVQYPLRRSYICTIKRAKTIVGVLSLLAFIVYVFAFFITDVIDDECQLKPEYKDLVEVINYVDTVMTLILPVVLIVGMNTMIAISLFKFRKTMQIRLTDDGSSKDIDMYHTSTSQSNSSTKKSKDQENYQEIQTCTVEKLQVSKSFKRTQKYSHIHVKKSTSHDAASYTQHGINRMLLVISSVFIILNFPSYLIRLCYYFDSIMEMELLQHYFDCVQQFAMLLYCTNFSINFLLYTMCGKAFRICLRTFFYNIFHKVACFEGGSVSNTNC
ncbi:unnamed protein product [Psylliodes chrysocephalus]|uniref:G-protein coupled receptors family 1 profile domain-containing protein n=1 Tax=Psylliodes chrysocephalus TaxID=3402493 RepID=A0A9P0D6C6_9CUCU|nr:unnamed protein product [Psylliodes chrysocephala]